VASDNASETLAALKRVHGLMPYFMLKAALKISNPIGMIRSKFARYLIFFARQAHNAITQRCLGSFSCSAIRWQEFIAEVKPISPSGDECAC